MWGFIGHFPHGGILVVDPFKEVIIKVNRSTTTVGINLGWSNVWPSSHIHLWSQHGERFLIVFGACPYFLTLFLRFICNRSWLGLWLNSATSCSSYDWYVIVASISISVLRLIYVLDPLQEKFSILQKYQLYSENHFHVWQVYNQLSYGDTDQKWKWYSKRNQCFWQWRKSEK